MSKTQTHMSCPGKGIYQRGTKRHFCRSSVCILTNFAYKWAHLKKKQRNTILLVWYRIEWNRIVS